MNAKTGAFIDKRITKLLLEFENNLILGLQILVQVELKLTPIKQQHAFFHQKTFLEL